MLILGLNAFHADSSACILRDGVLVAAAEEERFRRVKYWAGFPSEAIKWCLSEAGVQLSDLDHVAVNQDSSANNLKRLQFMAKQRPDIGLIVDRLRNRRKRASTEELLQAEFPGQSFKGRVHPVEHHMAHLSSAFHVSPFQDAVVVSVDGFGDFTSAAWGIGSGAKIDIDKRVFFPHSLGVLYQAVTQYLGFPNYGDEYKVMGLAPYGDTSQLEKMRDLLSLASDGTFELNTKYFVHHKKSIAQQWENGIPTFDELFSDALIELLGPKRNRGDDLSQHHKDIARSTQALYEEAFFNLVRAARKQTGLKDIAIAGGCANNSVANGKLRRETPFNRVYVHAAPGDQGGAIGAAYSVWHDQGNEQRFLMDHAYWGPSFDRDSCKKALDSRSDELEAENCTVELVNDDDQLCRRTAISVSEGKVVGWFQGSMEWGPRALGNRSIVCDPRRDDMKEILNRKIKRRESFRPFAPSVLEDFVGEWFEEDDKVPFMMQVFQIRDEKRRHIPAVTHADGSGRLQTVYRHTNPRYAALIEAFCEITGVPMVLNTSFNENEPVVCRPEEALACFLRTKMDVLVLGDWLVERRGLS
ncbi:MAG: carbamoyltransferase C-terminal domain-containing protein [Henriciella sp.]